MKIVEADDFLEWNKRDDIILDVRSPSEYTQGHIPGAISFPLFSDVERAEIGTLYKQNSAQEAILKGLEIVGPKLTFFAIQAAELSKNKRITLYCWRGGKRSNSMAWLLETVGFEISVLNRGYKAFRHVVLSYFEKAILPLIVLGGRTGSAKTMVLNKLAEKGQQILDLENMACHKGSAFGAIGETPQPTVEHFENRLFYALSKLDLSKPIWVENESRTIGKVFIPNYFWENMKKGRLINIEVDLETRLNNLLQSYDFNNPTELDLAFEKIRKKLGHEKTDQAKEWIRTGELKLAAMIALSYYDKCYDFDFKSNETNDKHSIPVDNQSHNEIANTLIKFVDN